MEQSWNPVNNYIYGPTVNSVYNQQDKETQTHRKLERILNRDKTKVIDEHEKDFFGKVRSRPEKSSNRKLLGEFINNEAPRICDHAVEEYRTDSIKKRFCTPLESYVSTGRDMVRLLLNFIPFPYFLCS